MYLQRNLCNWRRCKLHWWWVYANADVDKPRRCGITLFGQAFFWGKR